MFNGVCLGSNSSRDLFKIASDTVEMLVDQDDDRDIAECDLRCLWGGRDRCACNCQNIFTRNLQGSSLQYHHLRVVSFEEKYEPTLQFCSQRALHVH